ncbi:MAG: peptide transporter, partial [Candidatus Sumerlaeota bacterium]
RRALKPLSKQNLSMLLHAAYVMMMTNFIIPGGPLGWLVYRAYLSTSEVARDAGMVGNFPTWIVPPPDSEALLNRSFFHKEWMIPVAVVAFSMMISFIQKYTLGYLFFRLTSDVEKLPFPMASIGAQGTLALSESEERFTEEDEEKGLGKAGMRKKSERWRIFALGVMIGIGFGTLQVGVPAITGILLSKPFFLIPQPFVDTTTLTESFLPATPTGMVIDIGIIFLGFVLPFWVIMGTFLAILVTIIANPILHSVGILHTWQPGMNTVNTTFANSIDFWLSFGIGSALGIAIVSVYSAIKDLRDKTKEIKAQVASARETGKIPDDPWATPKGRGDYPIWMAAVGYFISAGMLTTLCIVLLPKTLGLVFFLIFYTFLFIPFISYVNARLMGISGQRVEIPYIKEMGFILSGAKGIDIWLAPIPVENYGQMAQSLRTNEIIGVRFRSLIKTDMVAMPTLFVLSLLFWSFIWKSDAIPSEVFPAAAINWELKAKHDVLMMSSTFVLPGEEGMDKKFSDTEFAKAIHPKVIGSSMGLTLLLYVVLSAFGLPITLIYGMIRGFGNMPHMRLLEVFGALLGRFYLQKKFGSQRFMKVAPSLMAGYFTGVGLIGMATIAMKLMKAAISSAPF